MSRGSGSGLLGDDLGGCDALVGAVAEDEVRLGFLSELFDRHTAQSRYRCRPRTASWTRVHSLTPRPLVLGWVTGWEGSSRRAGGDLLRDTAQDRWASKVVDSDPSQPPTAVAEFASSRDPAA